MKKIFFSIVTLLVLTNTQVSAQVANDTTLAFAIRSNIQGFSNKYWYTFDKKKFELNQDSAKLYQLVTNKILTKDYLYDHQSAWNVLTGEEYKHTDKRIWEKYNKNKSDVVDETGYWCNISTYTSTLEEWKTFQKTGNCKDSWRDLKEKGNKISKIGNIIVTETNDPSYLPWHPTVLPSEILVGYASSDCWRTPIALRYKKPKLNMVLLTDSLRRMLVDPARFAVIEKLVNDSNLVQPLQVVQVTTQDSTKFSLIVSKQDTILFQDFAKEDGDKISIYFDGEIVQESVSIEYRPYAVPTKSKSSLIEIIIESEGSEPPCTLEVLINNKQYLFSKKQGEKITISRK